MLIMLFAFALILYVGPVAVILLAFLIEIKCFLEIVDIGYSQYREHQLPLIRTLKWYFLAVSNLFILSETLRDHLLRYIEQEGILYLVIRHNRLISFMLYVCGFVLFVLTLKKGFYKMQFDLFGWTHVALLMLVTPCYLIIENLFTGMIWLTVPVMMVICNDVIAYMFGFLVGRMPLIKLSPRKTWEGFISAGISTVVFGFVLSFILCQFQYFVCPVQYNPINSSLVSTCEPSYLFVWTEYEVPQIIQSVLSVIGLKWSVVYMYPFQLHALVLAAFSSIIAPFGDYFASGLKRAFDMKDFAHVIPGHGGLMDRFDCQVLMATFTYVYVHSLAHLSSPERLLDQVFALSSEQPDVYYILKECLTSRGLI